MTGSRAQSKGSQNEIGCLKVERDDYEAVRGDTGI